MNTLLHHPMNNMKSNSRSPSSSSAPWCANFVLRSLSTKRSRRTLGKICNSTLIGMLTPIPSSRACLFSVPLGGKRRNSPAFLLPRIFPACYRDPRVNGNLFPTNLFFGSSSSNSGIEISTFHLSKARRFVPRFEVMNLMQLEATPH